MYRFHPEGAAFNSWPQALTEALETHTSYCKPWGAKWRNQHKAGFCDKPTIIIYGWVLQQISAS